MKADVIEIVCAVPAGRVVRYRDIGDHLMVPARHVAFILARLSATERSGVPTERAVRDAPNALSVLDVAPMPPRIRRYEDEYTESESS